MRRGRQDAVHEGYTEAGLRLCSHREKHIVKFDSDSFFRPQPTECENHIKRPRIRQHALEPGGGKHMHAVSIDIPATECQVPSAGPFFGAPRLHVRFLFRDGWWYFIWHGNLV